MALKQWGPDVFCKDSSTLRGNGWVWGYRVPGQQVIEVMQHMNNIDFDNETQCHNAPPDHATVAHMLLRNASDELREEHVVLVPEVNQGSPGYLPVSVCLDPFVLGVARPAEFAVYRGQHEADMVVGCRIDQVTEFFFARPASRPAVRLSGHLIGERQKVRKFPFNR